MNVVNTLSRVLGSSQMIHAPEERFVFRLKEADKTNDTLERQIIELADGRSVAEIMRTLSGGLDRVWATWIKRHIPEVTQRLEQRGFIQIENGGRGVKSMAINAPSGAYVYLQECSQDNR